MQPIIADLPNEKQNIARRLLKKRQTTRMNPTRRDIVHALAYRTLSVGLLLGLWLLASRVMTTQVIPGPLAVWSALQRSFADGYVWIDLKATLTRVFGAFLLAMVAGTVWGVALGTLKRWHRVFDFWVILLASTPSLLIIVTAYLGLGLNDPAAIVGGAAIVAPSITLNVWQGMKSLDFQLTDMARAFGVPRFTVLRRVLLPQTLPFLMAAARLGLTMTWKIMVFIELLGRPSGVGYRIQYWYSLFNMDRVLASALFFVVLLLLLDQLVLGSLERYLFRWRREASS